MTNPILDLTRLDGLRLDHGAHDTREDGLCLLEAVAWIAGENHSDHPACVSPVLAAYGRSLNDSWDADQRQLLLPFAARLPGTVDDDADIRRVDMAVEWMWTELVPTFMDLTPSLQTHAAALRAAAGAAAWDAARAAAWDAARAAAWAAAGDAAWAAAWDAARDAARDAAGDAARDAARDALKPAVVQLQEKALELYDRMITA